MEEKVLSSIGGVGAFGVFSVCLFFVFFTAMIVWVTRLTKCYLNSMGQLPLAEDEAPTGPRDSGRKGLAPCSNTGGASADSADEGSSALRPRANNL